jgi:hypothetical protein
MTLMRDDRGMVEGRRGVTRKEIAERYGKSVPTVKKWAELPGFPEAIGARGRSLEYDPDAVEEFYRAVVAVPELPEGDPEELVTLSEAAARAGIPVNTLAGYKSREGDWPEPVVQDGRTGLYRWGEMRERLNKRRRRRTLGSADAGESSS